MGGMIAETLVLQALHNGLATVQQTPSVLSDILDALSPAQLSAAQSYFGNPATKISMAPGFPMATTPLPFIGVTVADSQQEPAKTPIGMRVGSMNNGDGTTSPLVGAVFNGQFKSTIYTPNADVIGWLTEIVYWALFTQISIFTNAGMSRVMVNVGDYEPQPEYFPTFTFARGVFVSARYTRSYASTPIPNITSASIGVTAVYETEV